jgi:hypothetical protein
MGDNGPLVPQDDFRIVKKNVSAVCWTAHIGSQNKQNARRLIRKEHLLQIVHG